VDIDLKGFFDEVDHSTLLQLICQRVKCPTTLRLIRKWLRAPIQINGKLHKRRKGVPQGSPISPLLSNILLDALDKELERRNLKYVRYADDFSIHTKSKGEARKVGNEIYLFLRDKFRLPINRETPEHGSAKGAHEVLASEDLPILNCWDMHLFRPIRKESKED
jgi:retron-type reverse transcriptase